MVRTRIAPSPTGENLHIGNLYTALINYAVAKQNRGSFIIRIEDTDQKRFVKGAEEKILSTLKKFGLFYDEGPDKDGEYGPYRQSERLPTYKKYAEELIKKGHAYYCFCTQERLELLRKEQQEKKQTPRYDKHCLRTVKNAKERIDSGEQFVIRLNVTPNKKVWFDDIVRGRIEFDSNEIDDQVLIKSDGFPTYHMGVVVDDHLMEITHIIRAEEWISSTPKHVILYESIGWDLPIFAHVPILRNPDRSKLSKRKNPVWALWYLEEGFLPEAVLNYLSLMGWSHPEGKEIFSLEEFIQVFDLKDLKPVGPIFDLEKLKWMNGVYVRQSQNSDLKTQIYNFYGGKFDEDMIGKILPLAKERMSTLKDFESLAGYFFEIPHVDLNDQENTIAQDLVTSLENTEWGKDSIFGVMQEVLEKHSSRMPVAYKILTGKEKGLPLPESLVILGKNETLKRLRVLV